MKEFKVLLIVQVLLISALSIKSQVPAGTIMASGYYATISPLSDKVASETYINGIKTLYFGVNGPERVDGNPFLDVDFQPGEIGFSDSTRMVDIRLRYNIYMEQMQVLYDYDTLVVQPSYLIKYIRIGDQYFIFSLIYDKASRKFTKGYFEILAEGEYMLLKQYRRPLLYDSYATNYNSGGGTKKYYFGNETGLFYKKGEEAAEKVPRSNNKVVRIFPPQKQEAIASFIESNELQIRKQEDLIRLINFANGN